MSKKNNKNTQKNQHAFDLRREKEAIQKKSKTQQKRQQQQPTAGKSKTAKTKNKGFRIKKGVVIKGIRIKDAASKQRARELLAAEQEMRHMEVETPAKAPKQKLDAMTE